MPGGNATRWSDQVETMAKTWTETQKKLWENWYHLASAAPAPPMYADVVNEWRKVAAQGFEAWAATAEPTTQGVTQRLVASQKNFIEFLQFLADAWKSVASRAEAGEDWQNNLNLYTERFRQEFFNAPESMSHINQDLNELWRLYLDQWSKLVQPWVKSSQLARGHMGQAITGNGSELIAFANLYWDAYERSFGRLVESPSLGYTRELNEKLLKSFDAWRDFRQASFEYQVTLADTWVQAFDRMIREMVSLAAKGQPIQSLRQLALLWNNVADPVFIEVFRSKNYIQIQGRLLNTAMRFRLHQREITELYLKALDIPTRSEVDEAHRHVYEQRKEIRALKRRMAESSPLIRREREETGRTIEALQQEVKSLKESLAVVIAELSSLSAERLPAQTSPPATQAVTPKAKKKPAAAPTAPASSQEGGETR